MSTSATSRDDVRNTSNVQAGTYYVEHFLAWLATALSIALGVIGLLIAFGIITGTLATAPIGGAATNPPQQFWSASLWLLTGISSAALAFALHRTEHHFRMDPAMMEAGDKSMWMGEHYLAWIAALGAIVLGIIALLIGYDVFSNGYTVFDGVMWALASIGTSMLAATLHNVGHHQMADEEDYIVSVVERRVGAPRPMANRPVEPATRPTYEGPNPPPRP